MSICHVDIETRSRRELVSAGSHAYAEEGEIIIMCWAVDDGPVQCWDITQGSRPALPRSATYCAHNAAFESAFLPGLTWVDTSIMARALNLPASLGDCAKYLKLTQQKDTNGARLMRRYSINHEDPRKDPASWRQYIDYCRQDVETERAIYHAIGGDAAVDWLEWRLDQTINSRGVMLDAALIDGAISIDTAHRKRLQQEAVELTGLENPNSPTQIRQWLQGQGVAMPDMTKATVAATLERKIPPPVRKMLELRQQMSGTAAKKYQAMRDGRCRDGRARGLLQYLGAGNTGRWSGRRIQTQNFPRGSVKADQSLIDLTTAGNLDLLECCYPDVQGALASALRACITGDLVVADYSAIEARVLAWLAGEEWVLDVFRTHGKIYEATAAQMYGCKVDEVTKDQRQNGKGATLGAGYAGGAGAVIAFGIAPDIAERVVADWRKANPNIVKYWDILWRCAISAIRNPGKVYATPSHLPPVAYKMLRGDLRCRLPSGRTINYPDAKFDGSNIITGGRRVWSGIVVENLVQGLARDLLAHAITQCEAEGLRVIMHVHDEIICEGGDLDHLISVMTRNPKWADGLPLRAEGYTAQRFKK